jgi:predicted NUDIX family NTP pyrophosphohydrolase
LGESRFRTERQARPVRQDGLVTYDEAKTRLVEIARQKGGVVTAADVEADPDLAAQREIVSAAAHALAGSTNVFASASETGWFPYAELRFTELRGVT